MFTKLNNIEIMNYTNEIIIFPGIFSLKASI